MGGTVWKLHPLQLTQPLPSFLSYLPTCLSVSLHTCLPACLPVYLPVCLPVWLPACLRLSRSLHVSNVVGARAESVGTCWTSPDSDRREDFLQVTCCEFISPGLAGTLDGWSSARSSGEQTRVVGLWVSLWLYCSPSLPLSLPLPVHLSSSPLSPLTFSLSLHLLSISPAVLLNYLTPKQTDSSP